MCQVPSYKRPCLGLKCEESLTCPPASLSAYETYAQCCGAALSAGKSAEASGSDGIATRSINIIHHRIGILPPKNIDCFHSHGPQVSTQFEFPLQPQVQAGISREAQGIGRTYQLLLQIHPAVGIPGSIFEETTQLCFPDVRRYPAPEKQTIGSVPCRWARSLCRVKDGTERWIENFARMRPRTRIGAIKLSAFCEDRSEEHTSELQSQSNLVCRLLLE